MSHFILMFSSCGPNLKPHAYLVQSRHTRQTSYAFQLHRLSNGVLWSHQHNSNKDIYINIYLLRKSCSKAFSRPTLGVLHSISRALFWWTRRDGVDRFDGFMTPGESEVVQLSLIQIIFYVHSFKRGFIVLLGRRLIN